VTDFDDEIAMRRSKADESLRLAIIEHAEAHHYADSDTEMLAEFGIIGAWQPQVGNGTTIYTLHSHLNSTPLHVWHGLFGTGLQLAQEGKSRGDDDD
jgi:hypothetical protein